jgi:hypothetical protein
VLEGKPAELWLYYGNARAPAIDALRPTQPVASAAAADSKSAGVKPPVDDREEGGPWIPQRGVLLRAYRKSQKANPQTLPDLLKLAESSRLEGAIFCENIFTEHNRLGPSRQYISVYDGYLRIDKPGTYGFCTVSSEGNWVVVIPSHRETVR